VKKPVSKFAFQVHNLQRYAAVTAAGASAAGAPPLPSDGWRYVSGWPAVGAGWPVDTRGLNPEVGLCTLNQVDP
jgi:hypothetical protein